MKKVFPRKFRLRVLAYLLAAILIASVLIFIPSKQKALAEELHEVNEVQKEAEEQLEETAEELIKNNKLTEEQADIKIFIIRLLYNKNSEVKS